MERGGRRPMQYRPPMVASLRAGDKLSTALVQRMVDGLPSNKYNNVDYNELDTLAWERKFNATRSLMKIKGLKQATRLNKDQNMLIQHRLVWSKQCRKISKTIEDAQREVDGIFDQYSSFNGSTDGRSDWHGEMREGLEELSDYDALLEVDRDEFKQQTVDQILALRDDLKVWMLDKNTRAKTDLDDVAEAVESVKSQGDSVLAMLVSEVENLDTDLTADGAQKTPRHGISTERYEGVPEDFFSVICDDSQLEAYLIGQFTDVDELFLQRLDDIELKYESVVSGLPTGDWAREEHLEYLLILEQYPEGMANARALLVDRLVRHFYRKKKSEIVQHMRWWASVHFHQIQRLATVETWLRFKGELLEKSIQLVNETLERQDRAQENVEIHDRQMTICAQLSEKVDQWQRHLRQTLEHQSELAVAEEARIHEITEKVAEKEKEKRSVERQKIKRYKSALRQQEQLVYERQLLAAELAHDEDRRQQEHIRDRVDYRANEHLRKLQDAEQERQRELQERHDTAARLEHTKEKVTVKEEPDRLFRDTACTMAHRGIGVDENSDFLIQKPLFAIHTFSDTQTGSDLRLKLQEKLRTAGLMNSEYARHVMKDVPPPCAPRRDQQSSIFTPRQASYIASYYKTHAGGK